MRQYKLESLLELEKNSEWCIWLNNEALVNENGLHYSVYHDFGGGSLVHREALEPEDEHSIPWLNKLWRDNIKEESK